MRTPQVYAKKQKPIFGKPYTETNKLDFYFIVEVILM